jgi:hypothetical protein
MLLDETGTVSAFAQRIDVETKEVCPIWRAGSAEKSKDRSAD